MQERPSWCPDTTCLFARHSGYIICGGELRAPIPHNGVPNTHRLCIKRERFSRPDEYQVNTHDLDMFRWVFEGLDGQRQVRRKGAVAYLKKFFIG